MKLVLSNSEIIKILVKHFEEQGVEVKNMKYTHIERFHTVEITGVALECEYKTNS